MAKFSHRANDAIENMNGEIRRTIDWIEHDRPAYWKQRVQKAFDGVAEAKANLHRCLMYPINDEQPSCAEERAALKKAEAHLAHCREKQQRVRGWAQTLRHEIHEYEGRIANLKTLVESDAPRTVALLDRTLASLEKYATGSPGTGASGTKSPSDSAPVPEVPSKPAEDT